LCLVAFVAGSAHLHLHIHHSVHGIHGHAGHGGTVSKFNFGTVAAFLTWFGGTGYILMNWGGFGLVLILFIAAAVGMIGAVLIFLFAAKVLAPADQPLDPEDFRVDGALGTVSSPVLPNGTGEMIFVQQGRRRGVPIRSESGAAIPAGREVVVTRYEDGIAYVREWDELTA
jgi:membrane protein implicated in regulation of membrane protease activity